MLDIPIDFPLTTTLAEDVAVIPIPVVDGFVIEFADPTTIAFVDPTGTWVML